MNGQGDESRVLQEWLDQATQDLPARTATGAGRELLGHVHDAIDDYVKLGHGPKEALVLALADLGSARRLNQGLKDAHLGRRHYLRAMLLSGLVILAHFLFPMLYASLNGPSVVAALQLGEMGAARFFAGLLLNSERLLLILFDLILGFASIFVLKAFRDLLDWRFGLERLALPFRLAMTGLAVQMVFDVLNLILYGSSINLGLPAVDGLIGSGGELQAVVPMLTALGFLALGLGLFGIALVLSNWSGRLYGLKNPIIWLLGLVGGPMCTIWLLLLVSPKSTAAELVAFLSVASQLLIWPLLVLLFFRALHRPPLPPASTA